MPLKFVGLQMNNLVCREEVSNGRSDDVIPPEHSIRFAKEAGCTLHLIDGDHRLKGAIEMVEDLFGRFLNRVLPNNR